MTKLMTLAAATALAGFAMASSAFADAAAECKASLDAPGAIPEGSSLEEMEAGCDCMVGQVGDDTAMLDEIKELSAMDPETRMSSMSDELGAIVSECFPPLG